LSYFVCQAFLGDLIPKEEKFGSKQGKMRITQRGTTLIPKGEKKKKK